MRAEQPKDWLPLNLTSKEARAEALRLQETSREDGPHEILVETIREWLDTPVTASVALGGDDDRFDGNPGEEMFLRAAVRNKDILDALSTSASFRACKMSPEKAIPAAMASLGGWERIGEANKARRVGGVFGRWFLRSGNDRMAPRLWMPARGADDDGLLD